MKKSLILIYGLLLISTMATSFIANSSVIREIVVALIMVFATFKFLLVAFHFMELKKAHSFWKISLILTLGLLVVLIIGIK
jgi:hypothetical protein